MIKKGFFISLIFFFFLIVGNIPARAEVQAEGLEKTVCTRLEEYLKENNLYQNETGAVRIRVVYKTASMYRIDVEREDDPSGYTTLNIYEVDKRSGETRSYSCNQHFKLDMAKVDRDY